MDETNIESAVAEFLGRYVATKVLDGLGGKKITAIVESLSTIKKDRIKNVVQIFEAAEKKAEQQGRASPNNISPRVAERIFSEGSYCSEAIMQEYYAGVLLSNDGGFVDDEGVFYLSTIHQLSSIQLKAHYALYHVNRSVFKAWDSKAEILGGVEPEVRPIPIRGLTYIQADVLLTAIYGQHPVAEYHKMSLEDRQLRYAYYTDLIIQGLKKENLVRCFFTTTSQDEVGKANDIYFFFAPTIEGVQLFLWGQGYGKKRTDDFLKDEIKFPTLEGFHLAEQNFLQLYGPYVQDYKMIPTFNKQVIFNQTKQKFDR